jgi:hypothetical protein
MSLQIVRQPDGKYSVFSTIIDSFVGTDVTRTEIVEWMLERERSRVEKEVNAICDQLDVGGKPYFQFTMTYNEARREHEKRSSHAAKD